MPSKISRTHNFSGNEVSSQMGPYNPGTYDPPQAYPVASSYTSSAVAADALMSEPPNPRPRSRGKLLKKISKHFTKPEPETKPEPAPTAIIDWEAIVAETGSLSRYPALCTSSSGAALHAHPHKRLPERDVKHGRPNIESINDLGVMKNPSRTPKDEDPEWESDSESDSSYGSQSEKTRWPSHPPSRSRSPSRSRPSSRAPSASSSRPHSRSSRHGSRYPENDGASYYSNQHLLPPGHHGSTHSDRHSDRHSDHHSDHHSTHSHHTPSIQAPSTHSSTRPRAYSTSQASTHSHHSTSHPPPSTHSATEDPIRRMEADLTRTTALLNPMSPRHGPGGWSAQAAEEYRRYPPVPLASSTSSHRSNHSHRSRHSFSHPSSLLNPLSTSHHTQSPHEPEPYGRPYDHDPSIRSSRRHSGVPSASSTSSRRMSQSMSTPAEFHDMKDHGRLVNPGALPVVPQQFLQAHPESTGFYQYAGWSAPPPGASPTMPHAFPVPVPPPGSASSHGHRHGYGPAHGYGYPPGYGSVPVSTSVRSSRSSRSERRASETFPVSTSEGGGGGWMSWRPSFGRSRSKSVDQLQAAREADRREREKNKLKKKGSWYRDRDDDRGRERSRSRHRGRDRDRDDDRDGDERSRSRLRKSHRSGDHDHRSRSRHRHHDDDDDQDDDDDEDRRSHRRKRRSSWNPFTSSRPASPTSHSHSPITSAMKHRRTRSALVSSDPARHERRMSKDLHPRWDEEQESEYALPRRNRESGQAPVYPSTKHPRVYKPPSGG